MVVIIKLFFFYFFYKYCNYYKNIYRWNFEKILFDSNGHPFKRYAPGVEVEEIIPDIESMLGDQ